MFFYLSFGRCQKDQLIASVAVPCPIYLMNEKMAQVTTVLVQLVDRREISNAPSFSVHDINFLQCLP